MVDDVLAFGSRVLTEWTAERVAVLALGGITSLLVFVAAGRAMGWFRAPRTIRQLESERADLEKKLQSASRTIEQTKVRHKALMKAMEDHRDGEEKLRAQRAADEELFRRGQAEIQAQQSRLADLENVLEGIKREKTRVFAAGQKAFQNWRECERQLQAIVRQDGAFWESPPTDDVPRFVPLAERPMAIIAVMNLKGGVGKTTITANLGYALAKKKQRVLLVDLDHQASLTSLCLSPRQLDETRGENGKLVQRVFQANGSTAQALIENLAPVDGLPGGFCLPASPTLLAAEERLKAKWLLDKSAPDGRFLLRRALHDAEVFDRFDWVLIDCPPRPTAACINALAAADQVLVPTILDKVSADSLPLMLGWLRVLKHAGLCRTLDVLGIVANCTHWKSKLTNREKDVWDRLQKLCDDAWASPIKPFSTFVPDKGGFAEAAERHQFAASGKDIGTVFDALVKELFNRPVNHERRQPAKAAQ